MSHPCLSEDVLNGSNSSNSSNISISAGVSRSARLCDFGLQKCLDVEATRGSAGSASDSKAVSMSTTTTKSKKPSTTAAPTTTSTTTLSPEAAKASF